ncbi:glycosyltransferase [Chloroflexota bacterium]
MGRKRILFLIPSLVGGGAERAAVQLLEHLDRKRFEPLLMLFQDRCDYTLPPDVTITCLHEKGLCGFIKIIWSLVRTYKREKPDVVLSFMYYANLMSALARKLSRTKPRLLFSEHSHVSHELKIDPFSSLEARAIPWLYPQSEKVICVSQGVADDLVANFGVTREKIKVIYNPVDIDHILTLAKEYLDHPWFAQNERPVIIAMGRLVAEKGYRYLLKAFSQVNTKSPCRLVILGEGEEQRALNTLIRELGIEEQVTFLGFQKNPFNCLVRSGLFVLSSLHEGLPYAIIEAMACGIPVIATRCPSGPDEIITDGVNGLLVPVADEAALAEAMLRLLNDKGFATRLAQAGKKRAEDFAVAKIMKVYESLFADQP